MLDFAGVEAPMYIDGFVLPVPKKNLKAYKKMAEWGKRMWMNAGAVDYKECVGDDLKVKFGVSFTKLAKVRKGETVFYSFIVYKSRAHRDRVNKRVMKEMSTGGMPTDMPFDVRRMAYGGFKVIVSAKKR
jgi:uncharacterized protein YbaA (DUF1428 family)